jgi:putative sigma-54 modulation protein
MLEVLVRNAHGNLTETNKEYASKKLGKLDRYFNAANRVELAHTQDKRGEHKIDVTVYADGVMLHGNERDSNLNAAIDKVVDKLESRLRRLKSKIIKRHRGHGVQVPMGLAEVPYAEENMSADSGHIAEHRSYSMKPMSVEEASLQLELMDHEFFVFRNVASDEVEVIYRREKGGFGVFSPAS